MERDPELFKYLQSIWSVRDDHLVRSSIPVKYMFLLKCCGKPSCLHPRCCEQSVPPMPWFPGGPDIGKALPVPVIDNVSIGAKCTCRIKCTGHYFREPTAMMKAAPASVPTKLIGEEFKTNKILGNRAAALAKMCLVEESTVTFYWNHRNQVLTKRTKGA